MKQVTPKLKVGETWLVRLPEAAALSKAVISQVTALCVLLRLSEYSSDGNWYTKAEIKFVERVSGE